MKMQSLSSRAHADGSRMKFCRPQSFPGASQSETTEVARGLVHKGKVMLWLNQLRLHKHCRKMISKYPVLMTLTTQKMSWCLSKKHNLITTGKCPVVLPEISGFVATSDLEIYPVLSPLTQPENGPKSPPKYLDLLPLQRLEHVLTSSVKYPVFVQLTQLEYVTTSHQNILFCCHQPTKNVVICHQKYPVVSQMNFTNVDTWSLAWQLFCTAVSLLVML